MAMIPLSLLDGPAMVLPPSPANLFLAAWKRSAEANERVRALTSSPADGDPAGEDESGYLVLALGAKREFFGLTKDPETMTAGEMRAVLRSKMADWHPNLRKLAEMTTDDLGFLRIRTSQPVAPWSPSNVTLLGDAIHNMTPYRGIGANVALRDAALLCSKLVEAHKDPELPWPTRLESMRRRCADMALRQSPRRKVPPTSCSAEEAGIQAGDVGDARCQQGSSITAANFGGTRDAAEQDSGASVLRGGFFPSAKPSSPDSSQARRRLPETTPLPIKRTALITNIR